MRQAQSRAGGIPVDKQVFTLTISSSELLPEDLAASIAAEQDTALSGLSADNDISVDGDTSAAAQPVETLPSPASGGGGDNKLEELGRLLEEDFYSNALREKVVEEFFLGSGGSAMGGGGTRVAPPAVVRLLDEAWWVSLQVGDKVEAWNGKQGDTRGEAWTANVSAATITRDNCNGTYTVEYEDPTQLDGGPLEGTTSYGVCPESKIQDYTYKESLLERRERERLGGLGAGDDAHPDFRGRGKGTRAASLRNRPTVHNDPVAVDELLRWSRDDMGARRVEALVRVHVTTLGSGQSGADKVQGFGDRSAAEMTREEATTADAMGGGAAAAKTSASKGLVRTSSLSVMLDVNSGRRYSIDSLSGVSSWVAEEDVQTCQDTGGEYIVDNESGQSMWLDANGVANEGVRAFFKDLQGTEGEAEGVAGDVVNVEGDVSADRETTRLLGVAATSGDVELASQLIAQNANVNAQEKKDGRTSLYLAAEGGHLDLARLLVQNGAAVGIGGGCDGKTPLYIAVEGGHARVAAMLVKEGRADACQVGFRGKPPLHVATEKGHAEIAALLIQECGADSNQADTSGCTPLIIATEMGRTEIAALLINEGKANVDQADNSGITPLIIAAEMGHTEIAALLINDGKANVELASNDGWTPLYIAATEGHTGVAALLVEEGRANVDQVSYELQNDGRTPLYIAAEKGHTEIAALLIHVGKADVNIDCHGQTPLMVAKQRGHVTIVALLVGI
jgi:ankyrin repeat protein